MFVRNILAAGALLSLATAVPLQHEHHHLHLHAHEKRDVVWTTAVVEDYVTEVVTKTVWGAPPGAGSNLQHGPPGGGWGPRPTRTSHIFQTVTVQPQPAPQSAAPVAPSQPAVPNSAPMPSQQAPPPSAPAAPAPPSAAPAPPSAAPQPSAQPQPMPSSPPQPAPSSPAPSSPPSGGGGGGPFTGDITYYTPGLGSCGQTNTESDSIVALAEDMMTAAGGANPNENPLCGRSITISHGGVTAQATIMDTCPGCSGASLDLTPSLFEKFGQLSEGRISCVQWSYN